jgi:TatD DNase family protein
MIIDTHAHLNTKDFENDLNEVLLRAKESLVSKVLVIGMNNDSNQLAIKLAEEHEMLYATVGIHPSYVDQEDISHLFLLTKHQKIVAIGECGLDYYHQSDNKELQEEMFLAQVKLSIELNLPLIIHTRNSFTEAYNILKPFKGLAKGVFHCFSSNLSDAKKAIDLGFYIGIDGPITYKNNHDLIEILSHIDLKHILVETDSPYLSPAPLRSKRNEPSHLVYVIKKIAEILNISEKEVITVTTNNAYKLFNLGGI